MKSFASVALHLVLLSLFLCLFSLIGIQRGLASETFDLSRCERIKQSFPKARIDEIRPGPIPGLCEIWTGTNVLYYYPEKDLLFFGEIWNKEGKSLTQEARNAILLRRIRDLPLEDALRWGKGPVHVVVFTDPDCPFCRRLEKFLFSPLFEKQVTAHIFLYPLKQLHPHAEEHSLFVLCSKDPVASLLDLATGGGKGKDLSVPPDCKAKAEKRLAKMKKAALSIGVRGTPMVVVEDKVVVGADLERIASLIASKAKKAKN